MPKKLKKKLPKKLHKKKRISENKILLSVKKGIKKVTGRKTLYAIGMVLCAVLLGAVIAVKFGLLGGPGGSTEPGSYGFESGTQGWMFRVYADSMAITRVAQSTENAIENAIEGSKSLECTVTLVGGDPGMSKGEVYVDLTKNPPLGITPPLNLTNKTVSVWLYLPLEAMGDHSKPNGIQLFFKDADFKSKYSTWQNIEGDIVTDQWSQITVNTATESWAWDEGCNLTSIVEMGLKIGTGGGSTENWSGTFLMDNFAWDFT